MLRRMRNAKSAVTLPAPKNRKRVVGGAARRGPGRRLYRRVPCHRGVPCRGSLHALAASQRVAAAPGRAQEDARGPCAKASALAPGLCSWWYAGSLAVQNAWLYGDAGFLHFAWPGRGHRLAWAWHLTFFLMCPRYLFCAWYHMYSRAAAYGRTVLVGPLQDAPVLRVGQGQETDQDCKQQSKELLASA